MKRKYVWVFKYILVHMYIGLPIKLFLYESQGEGGGGGGSPSKFFGNTDLKKLRKVRTTPYWQKLWKRCAQEIHSRLTDERCLHGFVFVIVTRNRPSKLTHEHSNFSSIDWKFMEEEKKQPTHLVIYMRILLLDDCPQLDHWSSTFGHKLRFWRTQRHSDSCPWHSVVEQISPVFQQVGSVKNTLISSFCSSSL